MVAKNHKIGVIQKKCKFETRVAIPPKKIHPPFFPKPFHILVYYFRFSLCVSNSNYILNMSKIWAVTPTTLVDLKKNDPTRGMTKHREGISKSS